MSYWTKIKYGLNGLLVIPKTLQAYLALVAATILIGLFLIVSYLMPFEPLRFYGWTELPDHPVCPETDLNGAFEAEVIGGPYKVGHMRGISYFVTDDGNPLPGVVPIDADLEPVGRHEFPEISERVAPTVPGRAHVAWDATINGWMFWIVPVSYEHSYVSKQSITVLPIDDEQCLRQRGIK